MSKERVGVFNEWDPVKVMLLGNPTPFVPPGRDYVALEYNPLAGKFFEENRGVSVHEHADFDRCREQVENLAELMAARGIDVVRPRQPSPEEVEAPPLGFINIWSRDSVVCVDDLIIDTNVRSISCRRKDPWVNDPVLQDQCASTGQTHIAMPQVSPLGGLEGIWQWAQTETVPFLEGGDFFILDQDILIGHSGIASSYAGIEWARRLLEPHGYRIHTVEIEPSPNYHWVHLDCIFATPRRGLAVFASDYVKGGIEGLPKFLRDWEFIHANEDDCHAMACNGVNLDHNVTLVGAENERINEQLDAKGVELVTVPYDAVSWWGGGTRCSTHPLERHAGPS